MTIKERLHKIVDELTEAEADDALQYIASRQTNRVQNDAGYPAVVPAFSGRRATSAEFQQLLGHLPADGEG